MPGVDTFFSTEAFSFSVVTYVGVRLRRQSSKEILFRVQRKLTTENNNVKLPVAEWLIIIRDPGPETARLSQDESQQNLALLLVE